MGLDLRLLPFDHVSPGLAFSHTVLSVDRRQSLFDVLLDLPDRLPVPDGFTSYVSRDGAYEDSHYGVTVEDAYGDPLTTVTAAALVVFAQRPEVSRNPRNRAIWAYLAALPPETRVALGWH